jgi:hypothetical protein
MTLSERNTFFKAGIAMAAAVCLALVISSVAAFPVYPRAVSAASSRALTLMPGTPGPYVAFASLVIAVVYAFISIIVIYHYFKKTRSPEILYFAFYVLSFLLELSRIMIPLALKYSLPGIYLIMAARALLIGRYFGIFSLFVASVCAAGLDVQNQRNTVFILAIAALAIGLRAPIDGLSWDTSLCMIVGYGSMFRMIEGGVILMTVMSFFMAAYSRGTRAYLVIGTGAFLVSLGRVVLFGADTWFGPGPGLGCLILGAWLICTRLHQVYLWL